eukprot:1797-Heterococcus_DN1.PRE.2
MLKCQLLLLLLKADGSQQLVHARYLYATLAAHCSTATSAEYYCLHNITASAATQQHALCNTSSHHYYTAARHACQYVEQ